MRNNDPRPPSKDDTDSNIFFDKKKGAKNDSEWLIDDSQWLLSWEPATRTDPSISLDYFLSRLNCPPRIEWGPRASSEPALLSAGGYSRSLLIQQQLSALHPGETADSSQGQVTRGTLAHNHHDRAETLLRAPCHGCLSLCPRKPLPETSCSSNQHLEHLLMFNTQKHTLETIWHLWQPKTINTFLLMLISLEDNHLTIVYRV